MAGMDENPYKAPVEGHGKPPAAANSQGECLGGRRSIIFVALVFGTLSVLFVIQVLFNLTRNYPGTDQLVIVVDPLWMLANLIRGLGLGALTYALLRYFAAIKKCTGSNKEDKERLIATHDALWRTAAIALGVIAVASIVYVAFWNLRA